jgi:tight adherence protein B
MNQKFVILAACFVLSWAFAYVWLRVTMQSRLHRQKTYPQWIQEAMADMFYNFSIKQIGRTLLVLVVLGGLTGFLMPGKISQVEKRVAIGRAIAMNEQGEYNNAAVILEEIKITKSPIVHNELGIAYMGLRNFEKAERHLQTAVKLLPNFGKAHQNLAVLYASVGKNVEAGFEESRSIESEKFTLSEADLYNLPDGLTDQLGVRFLLAVFLGSGAYHLPRLVIWGLRKRRNKLVNDQLPDGLIMISNGLRAGLSLLQSMEMVAKESKPPLSQEFELILREYRLGSSLEDAIKHLGSRINSKDVSIMVNATLLMLESGGNLPKRFDSLAKTMQERKRIQKKIKAMTAEGETQAWILAGLPLVLALLLNEMNHEVFSLMYTTVLGWMVISLVVLLEVVGLYLMLKIVKVKI